jgi:uncharacterized membrane protein YoaK (UPF0700 family)
MFRNPGSKRTFRQNGLVAGYLAFVAGYVNAVGFVVLGIFTSHATGNVGRFANELASPRFATAGPAGVLVVAFFGGAFAASMAIESPFFTRPAKAYGFALGLEALLLCVFVVLAGVVRGATDLEAGLLSFAMGMQNSLVTRLSGAVVRTTHLTGVITDLGIEAARWFRWWRSRLSAKIPVDVVLGARATERPSLPKIALLGVIAGSFTLGAVLGSAAGAAYAHPAMLAPSAALAAGAAYAFAIRDASGSVPPPRLR